MIRTIAPQYWTFNALRALCYATLCRFAYRPDDTNAIQWRDTFGRGHYYTFAGPGGLPPAYSITQLDSGPIIIAFAGTETNGQLRDQILGSQLTQWEQDKGYVFLYAKRRFDAIRPAIEASLADLPPSDIYLTGHSLGGAVAQLFASHFQTSLPNQVKGVITFCSPRIGDETFRRSCRFPHVRVFHQDDWIPYLPFARGLEFLADGEFVGNALAYAHYGQEVPITRNGAIDFALPGDNELTAAAAVLASRREADLVGQYAHDLQTNMLALAYQIDLGQDWEVAWRMGVLIDDLNRADAYDWRMASIYPEFFRPGHTVPLIGEEVDTPIDITNPPARHQRHWSPSGRH